MPRTADIKSRLPLVEVYFARGNQDYLMAGERIACAVPFCRRTYRNKEGFSEWICAAHWRAVPKRLRRLYSSAKRRRKPMAVRLWLYARCKAAAIDRAFNLL